MAVLVQGSDLFALVPETGEIIDIGCMTSVTPGDSTSDPVETTCINDTVRSYLPGLATPGVASFTIQTDPQDANHVRLIELKRTGANLRWALGMRQQSAIDANVPADEPTSAVDSSGEFDFVLPATRSWILFEGYISAFTWSFELNGVVNSTVSVQVSGDQALIPATAS